MMLILHLPSNNNNNNSCAAISAGAAAETAASRKQAKYAALSGLYVFQPIPLVTLGPGALLDPEFWGAWPLPSHPSLPPPHPSP